MGAAWREAGREGVAALVDSLRVALLPSAVGADSGRHPTKKGGRSMPDRTIIQSSNCQFCGGKLAKAYVELDDMTWRVVWLCDCDVPEDTTGIVPFNRD